MVTGMEPTTAEGALQRALHPPLEMNERGKGSRMKGGGGYVVWTLTGAANEFHRLLRDTDNRNGTQSRGNKGGSSNLILRFIHRHL